MHQKRRRILISVISGLVAAALMGLYASGVRNEAIAAHSQTLEAYGGEQIEVFVATRDIAPGERLTESNVSRRVWLVELLPAGALTDADEVIGQTLGLPLMANEPVVQAKLFNGAPAITIPEGYVAVSIPTNDVLAVGGAVSAGSIIAIYAADSQSVELLAADVLVLETSNGNQRNAENNGLFGSSYSKTSLSWVTLAVREDMVEEIIVASRSMNLYLVLPGGEM